MTGVAIESGRASLIREGLRLEWMTVAWMVIEAAVAIWSGIAANSLSLLAFGADSLIELLSAVILLWRLSVELKHGAAFPEEIEHRASRLGGALLFGLAAYVIASAGWSVWSREGQEFSTPGFAVTLLAIPIMYALAKAKLRVAEGIGSRALRADAVESITCGYLSVAVVAGLLAQLLLGAWWIDAATSVVIVGFLVKEGREAWEGDACCE